MSESESESDEEMAALFEAEKQGKPAVTVLSASVNDSDEDSSTNEVPAAQGGGGQAEHMGAGQTAGSTAGSNVLTVRLRKGWLSSVCSGPGNGPGSSAFNASNMPE